MTANREKPEQLTFFFFEEMPKPTKGTIYLDTSKKVSRNSKRGVTTPIAPKSPTTA